MEISFIFCFYSACEISGICKIWTPATLFHHYHYSVHIWIPDTFYMCLFFQDGISSLCSAVCCLIVDNLLTIWTKVITLSFSKVYFIDMKHRHILLWLSKYILQNQHLILLQIREFRIRTWSCFLVFKQ